MKYAREILSQLSEYILDICGEVFFQVGLFENGVPSPEMTTDHNEQYVILTGTECSRNT